jgi:hypothetical protein
MQKTLKTRTFGPGLVTTIPAEVRDSILRHLLVLPAINYHAEDLTNAKKASEAHLPTAETDGERGFTFKSLTLTCKVLYFESVPLYYGYNSHVFDSWHTCKAFFLLVHDLADFLAVGKMLTSIGLARRQHVKDVTVRIDSDSSRFDKHSPGEAATLLGQCNLKRLKLLGNTWLFGYCSDSEFIFYTCEDVFCTLGLKELREIRGCEEVYFELCANSWVLEGDDLHVLNQQMRHFEAVLREELCQEKEQAS